MAGRSPHSLNAASARRLPLRPSRRRFIQSAVAAAAGFASGCRPPDGSPLPPRVPPPAPPRIAYANIDPNTGTDERTLGTFRQGLQAHGHVEGQNFTLEVRDAGGDITRFRDVLAELMALPVDIIVLPGSVSVPIAAEMITGIPVVTISIGDPVALGLATSLARPTRNFTGLSVLTTPLSGKRLQLLKETAPGIHRVGLLRNASYPETLNDWREIEAAAPSFGVEPVPLEVARIEDFENAFRTAILQGVDSLVIVPDTLTRIQSRAIAVFATGNGLPAIYSARPFVVDGGLMAYGPDRLYSFQRAAYYVDRILKGTNPRDLPFEQPTRFELQINLRTARALGLTVPRYVLLDATEVVE
jgi:putative tryptophan/tyrosine transport system substrate-binding protein